MPDIFLSYSRDDQQIVRRFAEGFKREGFSVWWDATLNPGEAFDQAIEKALDEAKAVVVLWSKNSVASRWVRAEATQANDNRKLVPVMIEPCKRPMMFELIHTADLSHWNGDPNDKAWQSYVAGVRLFVERGEPAAAAPQVAGAPLQGSRIGTRSMAILAAAAVIAGAIVWAALRLGAAHGTHATQGAQTAQAGGSSAGAIALSTPSGVSLAVLPFVDMSPQHDQDYFSDGLSEELLNQLAQIKELRVAGRTSSFSFKGKNEDLRVIGEKLGVNHLLEGSVRKDGTRLRITAQLINAADGTHLWSQTYDREMNDVFAVQEEIAKDVSGALSISLGVGEMSRGEGGTTSVEAYDKFLRARALRNGGVERADLLESAQLFREALALDPKFARAWSGLYDVLALTLIYVPEKTAATQIEMADASAHIVALAPDAWWTQTMRSDQLIAQHRWSEAEVAASAALAAAPASDAQAVYAYSIFLWPVGRAKEAADVWARARLTDPLSLSVSYDLQIALCIAGRSAELQAENQRSKGLSGDHAAVDALSMKCFFSQKSANEPASKIAARTQLPAENTALYRSVADKFDNPQAMRADLRKQFNDPINQDSASMQDIADLAGRFGDKDLALSALRRSYIDLHRTNIGDIWGPWFGSLRSEPRFKDLLRDLKLVDYWRASGNWGDFCQPVGTHDFECH